MRIQILEPGCKNCQKVKSRVENVLKKLNVEAEVEKVEVLNQMATLGLLKTPGLVIDGEIKIEGSVPSEKEIARIINDLK